MNRLFIAAALAAVLAGCATPQSPAQAIYQAKEGRVAALQAAVQYKRLPTCASPVQPPCKTEAAVIQLQKADDTAKAALDAAETAVRSKDFGKDVASTAVATALAALQAFTAILTNLGVK